MSGVGSGLVVVDKPAGLTSHDVVARVRRLVGTRKVGHAGTLDPMATGVLLVGVNRATRLLGHLMLTDKAYDAVIRLGISTATDDAEGEVVATTPARHLRDDEVRQALAAFHGQIDQVPTSVSAIKVDGERAYARVRAGQEVTLAARRVTIHELVVRGLTPGPSDTLDVAISVRCSSGTYIRAIARDLGAALGVGGHLTALRRTAVGPFDLAQARTLEQLQEHVELLTLARVARATFPSLDLDEARAAAVRIGRPLDLALAEAAGPTALFAPDGQFLALYRAERGLARPVAVFVG